ncbi:conserved hypothetical protein [Ricinus communis]|uniref:Uncharacterized protein n=1 Tax=Ricinus communis TaxID=3988 RepID=B9TGX1_RICCO|nr:conserved hypothetical protein [Ricinus communis]
MLFATEQAVVACQLVGVFRHAVARHISRTGRGAPCDIAELARDKTGVAEVAAPQREIVARPDEVAAGAEADFDRQLRMFVEEVREQRCEGCFADIAADCDMDVAARFVAIEPDIVFGTLQRFEDALAAVVKQLAFFGRDDAARTAVEQPRMQALLELGNLFADLRRGDTKLLCCGREAAGFDDLHEFV